MVISDEGIETTAPGELLARARAGDAPAFCQLIEPLQARLLRQAVALTGDVSVAEDLVSETLVEAWKSLARYDESCRFSTWLYAILLHRRQKWVRRARSRPLALAWLPAFRRDALTARHEHLPSPEPSPSECAVQNEFSTRLRECVDRLPERHRRVILLRFFQDASLSDMARVLGCSVGTVKSRLHHALEKLRKMKMNLPELKGDTQL
jgi:RNA polymerase sigma-70 factor (ECF subfamily)